MNYRIRLIFDEEDLEAMIESYFVRDIFQSLIYKTHYLKTENTNIPNEVEAKMNTLENNFVNVSENVTLTLQPKSIEFISPNIAELKDMFSKYKDQVEISKIRRIAFLKMEETFENFIIQTKINDIGYKLEEVESYEIHMNKQVTFHLVKLNEHTTVQKRGSQIIKTLDINTIIGSSLDECRRVYDNLVELVGRYE